MGPWEIGRVIALFLTFLIATFVQCLWLVDRSCHLQSLLLALKVKMIRSRSDNEKRGHRLDGLDRPPMNWDYCFQVISHMEGYAVIANNSFFNPSFHYLVPSIFGWLEIFYEGS
jgi:hypothetical protein